MKGAKNEALVCFQIWANKLYSGPTMEQVEALGCLVLAFRLPSCKLGMQPGTEHSEETRWTCFAVIRVRQQTNILGEKPFFS